MGSYDGMSKYDAFAELASQAYGFTQYDMVDTTTGPEVTDSSGYESTGYTGYELDGFNGTEATGSSGTDAVPIAVGITPGTDAVPVAVGITPGTHGAIVILVTPGGITTPGTPRTMVFIVAAVFSAPAKCFIVVIGKVPVPVMVHVSAVMTGRIVVAIAGRIVVAITGRVSTVKGGPVPAIGVATKASEVHGLFVSGQGREAGGVSGLGAGRASGLGAVEAIELVASVAS